MRLNAEDTESSESMNDVIQAGEQEDSDPGLEDGAPIKGSKNGKKKSSSKPARLGSRPAGGSRLGDEQNSESGSSEDDEPATKDGKRQGETQKFTAKLGRQ